MNHLASHALGNEITKPTAASGFGSEIGMFIADVRMNSIA